MRLARSVLENLEGTQIFGIIGFLIFFTFFIGVLIYVIKMRKNKVDEYSRLPLSGDEDNSAPASENDNNPIEKP